MRTILITPTGGRPEALNLCEKYVLRQTYRENVRWHLIFNDPSGLINEHLRKNYWLYTYVLNLKKVPPSGISNLAFSLLKYFKKIRIQDDDNIIIIEDDDWYGPRHVEVCVKYLKEYDLVGQKVIKCYHVPSLSFRSIYSHTGTFATMAFKGRCVQCLAKHLKVSSQMGVIFDNEFWKSVEQERPNKTKVLSYLENQVICMKGMPGRSGCIRGHHKPTKPKRRFIDDIDLWVLKNWIGDDYERYLCIHRNHWGEGQAKDKSKLGGES